jgi:hypothetical protein
MILTVCVVKYGDVVSSERICALFARYFPEAQVLILNNKPGAARNGEIQGSNAGHEFSGYLEVMAEASLDGQVVVLNDTFFKNHFTWGWLGLLKKVLGNSTVEDASIYGDVRYDGTTLLERPNPFFASWIFCLSGETAIKEFGRCLSVLLADPQPSWSPAYERFLSDWLQGTTWYKGWHRANANEELLLVKKRNIYWEHRLSALLLGSSEVTLMSMGEVSPRLYRCLRWSDRFITAIYRVVGLIWPRRANFDTD